MIAPQTVAILLKIYRNPLHTQENHEIQWNFVETLRIPTEILLDLIEALKITGAYGNPIESIRNNKN